MTAPRMLAYGRHTIEEDDIAAVAAVLRGDWLTGGPSVTAFEEALAARVGAPHAVVCSSATAALHLAYAALGVGPGDIVIVPTITFLATANAARYLGAEVVFADADPDTGLMGPTEFEAAITRAGRPVKAVAPVHLTGQNADLGAIQAVARKHGIFVIEDASHSVGASYAAEIPVGSCRHSDCAVFSFHPVKTIAMGEGGAVVTRDPSLAAKVALLRSHGMVRDPQSIRNHDHAVDPDGRPNPWYYEMSEIGYNYRASDINCALALSQLGKLDRFIARRRQLADRYDTLLKPFGNRLQPIRRMPGCHSAWHLYVVLIDFAELGKSRAQVCNELRDRGIGTQVHYIPVHSQPYYQNRYGVMKLPGAEAYYDRCLTLPLYPGMSDDDQDRVVQALSRVVAN